MKKQILHRYAALCLAALAVLSLAGCGSGENVIDRPAQTPAPGLSDGSVTSRTARAEAAESGYAFIHNGVRVDVDAEAAAIVEALGEPVSYYEAPSCVFEGIDRMYTYSGFELDTYPTNGKDYVSAVIFRDGSVATPEGLMIGDSAEKIRQTYGEPGLEEKNLLTYTAGNMQLRFILEDGTVAAIEYISLALVNG